MADEDIVVQLLQELAKVQEKHERITRDIEASWEGICHLIDLVHDELAPPGSPGDALYQELCPDIPLEEFKARMTAAAKGDGGP